VLLDFQAEFHSYCFRLWSIIFLLIGKKVLKTNKLDNLKFAKAQSFYLYYTWFIILMTYVSRVKDAAAHSGTALGYQVFLGTAVLLLVGHFYLVNKKPLQT
jgi:hypothetical protein